MKRTLVAGIGMTMGLLVLGGCAGGETDGKSVDLKGEASAFSFELVTSDEKPAAEKPAPRSVVKLPGEAGSIRAGEVVSGSLGPTDAQMTDGSFADQYIYAGTAGEELTVALSSDDFDAYLILGSGVPDGWEWVAGDDDGGDGLDSRLTVVLPETGTYTVVANSFGPGATGDYTLSLSGSGRQAGVVSAGQNVSGTLGAGDLTMTDGSFFEAWVYEGRAGEVVDVSLESTDFDAFLVIASGTPGSLEFLDEDDDGGENLNSRLTFVVPEDGVYSFLANSYEAATGDYVLTVSQVQQATDYASLYPGTGDPDQRYALLVGISDYPGTESDLDSPANDARIMRDVLIDTYGYDPENVVTILDLDATRDHVINAFLRHLGQAGPGGTALFYYSGHGTQLDSNVGLGRPLDPEEGDDLDEALYVVGHGEASGLILDDEVGYLLDQLSTDRTLVILDSCNSGTGTRGTGTPKRVSMNPSDIDNVLDRVYLPRTILGAKERAVSSRDVDVEFDTLMEARRPHVLISGSREDEYSWVGLEWPDRNDSVSVFTYYLAEALEGAGSGTTFEDLTGEVRDQTTNYSESAFGATQTPQVRGDLARVSVVDFLLNN